jgi:hypothetical protein
VQPRNPSRARRVLGLVVVAVAFVGAPLACAERSGAGSAAAAPHAAARAKADGDAASEEVRVVSTDPLWQAARSGDPVDLGRLADHEGALALLDGLRAGGPWLDVALRALPLAEDAALALASLCALLEPQAPSQREKVLRAVHAIVAEPPRPVEELAAEELAVCDRALARLLRRAALPAAERDLAQSARRMLAERTLP